MKNVLFVMKVLLLILGAAALFSGVLLGEWGETMFNASLL